MADYHDCKDSPHLQKIEVERKTQEKQTDLAFLSRLAREYGIVFSVRGDQLVFMDTEEMCIRDRECTFRPETRRKSGRCDPGSQKHWQYIETFLILCHVAGDMGNCDLWII